MKRPLAVLAFSGGLDTTVVLHWLLQSGWDVATYTADLGQPGADLEEAREKARRLGAVDSFVEDLRSELLDEFFLPLLQMHARYEGRYLMGTSIARIPTARAQVRYAKRIGGNILVHGATGKGNDQVRFESIYRILQESPEYRLDRFEIFAPWKDPDFLARFEEGGRDVMLAYAAQYGLPVPGSSGETPPYSQDANALHISSEGRALERPSGDHREVRFTYLSRWDETVDEPDRVRIHFVRGKPVRVEVLDENRDVISDRGVSIGPEASILPIVEMLNAIGGRHGVGLLDMVETRYVGVKSRGVYEAPAHTILLAAHEDLESLVHTHGLLHDKAKRSFDVAESVYQGRWFSHQMDSWLAANSVEQERVTGWSEVRLFKGSVLPVARDSEMSLYNEELSSFNTVSELPLKARGFIDIQAMEAEAVMRQRSGQQAKKS